MSLIIIIIKIGIIIITHTKLWVIYLYDLDSPYEFMELGPWQWFWMCSHTCYFVLEVGKLFVFKFLCTKKCKRVKKWFWNIKGWGVRRGTRVCVFTRFVINDGWFILFFYTWFYAEKWRQTPHVWLSIHTFFCWGKWLCNSVIHLRLHPHMWEMFSFI